MKLQNAHVKATVITQAPSCSAGPQRPFRAFAARIWRSLLLLCLTSALCAVALPSTATQQEEDEWSPYEIEASAPSVPGKYTTTSSDAALQALARKSGGRWSMMRNDATGVAHFAWGSGSAVALDGSDAAFEQKAREFIGDNPGLFGVAPENLVLLKVNNVRNKTAVVFQQYYREVPVIDATVHVYFHDAARIVAFASDAHPDIAIAIKPTLSLQGAAAQGESDLPNRGSGWQRASSQLKIRPRYADPATVSYQLVWETQLEPAADGPSWRLLVDAHSSETISRERTWRKTVGQARVNYEFGLRATSDVVTGTVMGEVYSPVGQALEHSTNPPTNLVMIKPLPYVKVVVGGEVGYTDVNGNYGIPYSGPATDVTVRLEGLWANVDVIGETRAALTQTYDPANPGPVDFTFEFSSATPNARADELNAYYHVSVMHDYINNLVDGLGVDPLAWRAVWDYQIPVEVNDPVNWDNASGSPTQLTFGNGIRPSDGVMRRGVPSLQTSVVYHEYGHALTMLLQDFLNVYGVYGNTSEGASDITGWLQTLDPLMWRGWNYPECNSFARDVRQAIDYYDDSSDHNEGTAMWGFYYDLHHAWGGADVMGATCDDVNGDIWTFANNATRDQVADLWLGARFLDFPRDRLSQIIMSFILDDDDGDLTNGTPHVADLCAAAENNGFFWPGDAFICDGPNEFGADWVDVSEQMPQETSTDATFLAVTDMDWGGLPDLIRGTTSGNDSRVYFNDHVRDEVPFSYSPTFGDGSVTVDEGITNVHWVAYADYDSDGSKDIFFARDAVNYVENGRGFRIELGDPSAFSRTGGWADFDRDGDLDLFVGSVEWSLNPGLNDLFEFDATGDSFATVTPPAIRDAGDVYSSVWTDFDGDGKVDLFLACDATGVNAHKLFLNVTDTAGPPVFIGFDVAAGSGRARSMACEDINLDGLADVGLVFDDGSVLILANNGDGTLSDVTVSTGLSGAAGDVTDMAWGDFDSDGDIDAYFGKAEGVTDQLWENTGGSPPYALVATGPWQDDALYHTQAVSFADHDANGYADIFVVGDAATPPFTRYSNRVYSYLKGKKSWLTIGLRGNESGSDGLGAVVTVDNGTVMTKRPIGPHGLGSNDPVLHFGLGTYAGTVDVTVQWPSGRTQVIDDLEINQRLTIEEPAFSKVTEGDVASPAPTHGIAWGDLDGDGDVDLYLGNATGANQILLYHEGVFTDATGIGDAASSAETHGVSLIDYDNDGDLDIYAANFGAANELFRNNGDMTFDRVAAADQLVSLPSNSTGAAWADFDNDGLIDLYVLNYQGPNHLMRNLGPDGNGEPVFEEVSLPALQNTGKASSAAVADANLDGLTDIYVVNEDAPNVLLVNMGGMVFVDATDQAPVLADAGVGIGAAWGDIDFGPAPELYLSNAAGNRLFRNDSNGLSLSFTDVTDLYPEFADNGNGRGVTWGDADNDGHLDMYLSNLNGPNRLFRYLPNNNGSQGSQYIHDRSFSVDDDGAGFGAAWADYDSDGDLDLYHSRAPGDNILYRNDVKTRANWIAIDLDPTASNGASIGARVEIHRLGDGDSEVQSRMVGGDAGYMSQNSSILHFGLGLERVVDEITVYWPSGIEQKVTGSWADQVVTIVEPDPLTVDADYLGQVYLSFQNAGFEARVATKTIRCPRGNCSDLGICGGDGLPFGFSVLIDLDFADLGPEFASLNDVVGLREYDVEVQFPPQVFDPVEAGGSWSPNEFCFIPGTSGGPYLLVSFNKCLQRVDENWTMPDDVRIRLVPPVEQRVPLVPYGPTPSWETCGDAPARALGFYPEWASNWIIINPVSPTVPRLETAVHAAEAQVALVFDEFMNAGTSANYVVFEQGNPGNTIAVTNVTRLTEPGFRNVVVLDLATDWTVDKSFAVTITGIADQQGHPLPTTTLPIIDPDVGLIAISEIMARPYVGTDAEWFEIVNYGATDVDLNGWVVRDNDGESHVISSLVPVVVHPGEHRILARNAAALPGVDPGDIIYEYGGFLTLDDDADEIIIETPAGREIDAVSYGAGWPVFSEISMQWNMSGDNADPATWGFTAPAFGSFSEAGTPGAANVFQPPLSGNLPPGGGSTTYTGALLVAGDIIIPSGADVEFASGTKVFISDSDVTAGGLDPAHVEWFVHGDLKCGGPGTRNVSARIYPATSLETWGPIILSDGQGPATPKLDIQYADFTGMSTAIVKSGTVVDADIDIYQSSFAVTDNGIEVYDLDEGDDIMITVCGLTGPGWSGATTGFFFQEASSATGHANLTLQGYHTVRDFGTGIDSDVGGNALFQHVTVENCALGVRVSGADASVVLGSNLTVSGSIGTGIWLEGGSPGPTISGITSTGNNGTALLITDGGQPAFSGAVSHFDDSQTGIKLEAASSATVVNNVDCAGNSATAIYIVGCSPTIDWDVATNGGNIGIQVSGNASPLVHATVANSNIAFFVDNGATPLLRGGQYMGFNYGVLATSGAKPDAGTNASPGANTFDANPSFYYYLVNSAGTKISMQKNCYNGDPEPPAVYFYGTVIYLPGLCIGE